MVATARQILESPQSMRRRVLRFYKTLCDSPRWDDEYAQGFEQMWQAANEGDGSLLQNLIRSCNDRLIDQMIHDRRFHGHFLPPISGCIDPAR